MVTSGRIRPATCARSRSSTTAVDQLAGDLAAWRRSRSTPDATIASASALKSANSSHRLADEGDERLARIVGSRRRSRRGDERRDPGQEQRLEERPLGREVAIDGADADLRELGDLVDGHVDAVGGHQRRGRLEDALAVALRVGAQVPLSRPCGAASPLLSLGRPRAHRSSWPVFDKRNHRSV